MFKKGFTLVELIGVVIILALISLLAFPTILNSIRNTKSQLSAVSKEILYSAASSYVSNNLNDFPKKNGNTFCVTLESLVQNEYLPTKVYDSVTGEEIPLSNIIEVKYEQDRFNYNINNECVEYVYRPPYQDNSGANIPELLDNMVPIKYNESNWVVADITQEWYNYDNKEWANAVVLNTTKNVGDTVTEDDIDLWYVWIPRYKYQLFNANNGSVNEQEIQIQFESGTSSTGTVSCTDNISGTDGTTSSQTCTNASNGNWYNHPAFTFGSDELAGFWVGKFEISGSTSKITIKPNVTSLSSQTVSSFFTAIQNINTTYNLNGDSHMMKNMEWGAVAYLSHSKYGINEEVGINNNKSYITGCGAAAGSSSSSSCNAYNTTSGMLASTTGNIYGVYDMSGGAFEYVMGNMVNNSGAFYSNDAGFSTSPESKYYDKYTYGTTHTTRERGKLGDATKETNTFGSNSGGWYSDHAYFPESNFSWFDRGGDCNIGSDAGLFDFYSTDGGSDSDYSARAVACVRG